MSAGLDWRAILKRYMEGVLEEEGVTYVDGIVGYGSNVSDEVKAALREVESEVLSERPEWDAYR